MLVSYTETHFMAEQLIMRLHAYPDYEAHQREHDRSMELLADIRDTNDTGESALTEALAERLERLLVTHMEHGDQALAAFLAEKGTPGLA